MALAVGLKREDEPTAWELAQRLAYYIDPPYPDATASYKGWRAEVYDPNGALASPSNVAVDLVRAHADGKRLSEPKAKCVAEVKVDGEQLEKLVHDAVVKLTGIDRDVLLKLVYLLQAMGEKSDEKGRYDLGITFTSIADRIREALGESDG